MLRKTTPTKTKYKDLFPSAFTQMIKMVKLRHNNVVPTMALGVQQLRKELGSTRKAHPGFDEIDDFLDRFYMSRIGILMLIGLQPSYILF
jgi:pyruvate dehydrogenase kinase 2/3/4